MLAAVPGELGEHSAVPSRRRRCSEWALGVLMLVLSAPVAIAFLVAVLTDATVGHDDTFLLPLAAAPVLAYLIARRRPAADGRLVRPGDEPELARLVHLVADLVGFTAPLTVRIMPEPNAVLTSTRFGGVRGYVLGLGWPLLRMLPANELATVVAHELTHAWVPSSRRERFLAFARAELADSFDGRLHVPRVVALPLLASTRHRPWDAELAADAVAARVGTDNCGAALTGIELIAEAFETFGGRWFPMLLDQHRYPGDFYSALATAYADPYVRRRLKMFNLHVNLAATGSSDLVTTLERLMDEIHAAEGRDGRLSCSVDFTVTQDRGRADVGVDLDIEAPTDVDAFAMGMTWLRSAAHAAGAGTPTWETATPTSGHVTLSLTEPVTLGQADLVGA